MLDIEPLEPESWFEAIGKLSASAASAFTETEQARLLRRSYHLVALAPRPLRETIRPQVIEEEFERLLECGALESASLGFVAQPFTFVVASLESGMTEAQVSLPGQAVPNRGRSPVFALAILGAWSQCIASLARVGINPAARIAHPDPRISPSGSHRKLSQH